MKRRLKWDISGNKNGQKICLKLILKPSYTFIRQKEILIRLLVIFYKNH